MDIKKMMQQAQKMQKEMEKKMGEIDSQTFTHESNGVKVTIQGTLQFQEIEISEDILDDREMLQDLVIVAVNEAIKKVEAEKQKIYGEAQQGMKGGSPF